MTVAWIECVSGASGDMFLGAWLDLGVSEEALREKLSGLSVQEYELVVHRVMKSGITATKVDVLTEHSHHHRHLPDIERIIDNSDLPEIVKQKSKEAFYHLAVAEATVHGTIPEKIHFHEVGAVDAIVDIVGSMIAWDLLGQPECVVSPVEVGGGTVRCQHGLMPVPAPATALLLQGFQTYSSGLWGETTTPTGAAILRTLAKPYRRRPFISKKIGYGAGTKELPVANMLRIQLGDWAGGEPGSIGSNHQHAHTHSHQHDLGHDDGPDHTHDHTHEHSHEHTHEHTHEHLPQPTPAVVIEANLDDMTPELAGYVTDRLLQQGAMDATWTPMVMKKGRPAMRLQVLCAPDKLADLETEIFRQTSSIGLRRYAVDKLELPRRMMEVATEFGTVEVKAASFGDVLINVKPEYESCKELAERHRVPLKQVYQAALTQATLGAKLAQAQIADTQMLDTQFAEAKPMVEVQTT